MSNTYINQMVERGWTREGAEFIFSRLDEDPKFKRFFMRRMFGVKSPRLPQKPKAKIAGGLRRRVYERDAYRCQHCGTWLRLTVDHIIPESKGGPTTFDNLQTLCRSCNSKKGSKYG